MRTTYPDGIPFQPGDLALVCPDCFAIIGWLIAHADGTPATAPTSPQAGRCKRHGWVHLRAVDPVMLTKRAA